MYVYILHFEDALHHARHYTGSTTNLKRRLEDHALGQAARLTEVLKDLGMNWRLGALYIARHGKSCRAGEREAKRCHNGPRYCEICKGEKASKIEGFDLVPLCLLENAMCLHAEEIRRELTEKKKEEL